MTVDLLSKLSGELDAQTVKDRIRAAHGALPEEKCMAWRHKQKFPTKEGGCDIHKGDE